MKSGLKRRLQTGTALIYVAAFLLFDFGAFNHGQIFILLFFEKRLKIV